MCISKRLNVMKNSLSLRIDNKKNRIDITLEMRGMEFHPVVSPSKS